MRPIDLAREHGLSAQAVRNYEDAGVLPPAPRSATGHRRYTARHALALRAFVALVPGTGHATAVAILAAAGAGRVDDALDLVDRAHADLVAARRTVDAVETALSALAVRPGSGAPIPIGTLAHQLRLRPATLRRWEQHGVLRPDRDGQGHRSYAADDVHDAHLVDQLRRAGHGLAAIGGLLGELRRSHDPAEIARALAARRQALRDRSRALLAAAVHLDAYFADVPGSRS